MSIGRKNIVFDFDGVIHSYTSGWQGETVIPDPPVPGIADVLRDLNFNGYNVIVVSARCQTKEGQTAISEWLVKYGLAKYVVLVTDKKPPAHVYVDDRAICFDGHSETLYDKIVNFKPWCKE